MKVFVSWSGELSQNIAKILKTWIPCIIQSAEVFYSSEDIEKGENWDAKVSTELSDCNYGIVCLTPDNVGAPWIHFAAGAISKTLDSRVTSLMLGVNPSDIKGPLSRFQATKADKNDFFQMLQSINNSCDTPLNIEILRNIFEVAWTNIDKEIKDNLDKYKFTNKKDSPNKVMNANFTESLEEILQLVRKQNSILSSPEQLLPVEYFKYIQNDINQEPMDESILTEIIVWLDNLLHIAKCNPEIVKWIDETQIRALVRRIKNITRSPEYKISPKFANKLRILDLRLRNLNNTDTDVNQLKLFCEE